VQYTCARINIERPQENCFGTRSRLFLAAHLYLAACASVAFTREHSSPASRFGARNLQLRIDTFKIGSHDREKNKLSRLFCIVAITSTRRLPILRRKETGCIEHYSH
jgi:hypothetical protein